MKTVAWKRSRVLKLGAVASVFLLGFVFFIRSGSDKGGGGWKLRSSALVRDFETL